VIPSNVWGFGPTFETQEEQHMANEYPKWVQRDQNIGAVLCCNKAEEDELLGDWQAAKVAEAKKEAEAAEKDAAEAKAQAELTIKAKK
jgi:hypothetical protein